MAANESVTDRVNPLIQLNEESAMRLYSAAEHIRNRGLKLILKSYVQQRVRFADELRRLTHQTKDETKASAPVAGALSRGWTDIKATMTVRRQGRQHLVLREVAVEEAAALSQYADALKAPTSPAVQATIEQQYNTLRTIQRRLALLAAEENSRVLVRLYNQAHRAEAVVQELTSAGFTPDDIYTAAVEDMDIYTNDAPQQRRSMRDTVTTTVVLGAGLGALLGLLLGIAQRTYFPELGGIFTTTPTGLLIELIVIGALIGALFAFIFGLFMGRDAVEDDTYLETESLGRGDMLVAVFTNPANRAEAERIVGLRHQFEVEPAAA